jgi:hypothetical protein
VETLRLICEVRHRRYPNEHSLVESIPHCIHGACGETASRPSIRHAAPRRLCERSSPSQLSLLVATFCLQKQQRTSTGRMVQDNTYPFMKGPAAHDNNKTKCDSTSATTVGHPGHLGANFLHGQQNLRGQRHLIVHCSPWCEKLPKWFCS